MRVVSLLDGQIVIHFGFLDAVAHLLLLGLVAPIERAEVGSCRPVDPSSQRVESRALQRSVEALLDGVPPHQAVRPTAVGAHGGVMVKRAVAVAVRRDEFAAEVQHRPCAGGEVSREPAVAAEGGQLQPAEVVKREMSDWEHKRTSTLTTTTTANN